MALSGWTITGIVTGIGALWYLATRKRGGSVVGCSEEFSAFNHGGKRSPSSLLYIVLHSTESESARGAAQWFATKIPIGSRGPGSTQIVIDNTECYRTLPDDAVPYGAPPLNESGLHIELAGFARWSRAEWLKHDEMLRRAAAWVSYWSKTYGIPLRVVDAAGLKAGKSGVTTHSEISNAFRKTDHQDPGPNFPMDVVMRYAGAGSTPTGPNIA